MQQPGSRVTRSYAAAPAAQHHSLPNPAPAPAAGGNAVTVSSGARGAQGAAQGHQPCCRRATRAGERQSSRWNGKVTTISLHSLLFPRETGGDVNYGLHTALWGIWVKLCGRAEHQWRGSPAGAGSDARGQLVRPRLNDTLTTGPASSAPSTIAGSLSKHALQASSGSTSECCLFQSNSSQHIPVDMPPAKILREHIR